MTLLISDAVVRRYLDLPFVLDSVEAGFVLQANGGVLPPHRLDVPVDPSWLRAMAVGVPGWGVYGVKLMNMTPEVGLRYMVAMYDLASGALLALVDAKTITAMRTAASAALAAKRLAAEDVESLAIIGTGNEARRLLQAMLHVRPATEVRVYSRNAGNRQRFVAEARDTYPARFVACDSLEAAVAGAPLVALATKSPVPVLSSVAVADRCHVSSIGASRPDQAELAADLLQRAETIVCDSVHQVFAEAGDVRAAVAGGAIREQDAVELSAVITADTATAADGVSVYKSVGTALQDLAVVVPLLDRVRRDGTAADLGDFPTIKPFV